MYKGIAYARCLNDRVYIDAQTLMFIYIVHSRIYVISRPIYQVISTQLYILENEYITLRYHSIKQLLSFSFL